MTPMKREVLERLRRGETQVDIAKHLKCSRARVNQVRWELVRLKELPVTLPAKRAVETKL